MAKRIILTAQTPLGYRVILTRDRWREILRFKHPAIAGYERQVGECLRDPDVVRSSEKDPHVHLYYRSIAQRFLCVVVGSRGAASYFVITAYFTKELKKGEVLWTK